MILKAKNLILTSYEKNETRVDIFFFLGGVLFDILTLSQIDDPISIAQQICYLIVIGYLLFQDFLVDSQVSTPPSWINKIWDYRQLIVHFLMGSLLSLYSLFFIKSASLASSFIFLALMLGLMVANEMKLVQKSTINLKLGLYYICLFSFFSMLYPILLGFVGWTPFGLAITTTALFIFLSVRFFEQKMNDNFGDQKRARLKLIAPGAGVLGLFFVFYLIGWIPPVPLSVQEIGIYHKIEKREDTYIGFHESPFWRFWKKDDKDFIAEPNDRIFVFAKIFSPARFDDSVILHWQYKNPELGWQTSDRIPMRVTGGRQGGYRGFAFKQNFSEGHWRIKVETTSGQEIGRYSFTLTKAEEINPERTFIQESLD